MERTEREYYYYTKNHYLLFHSLQRYLKYILDIDLIEYSDSSGINKNDILFIYSEERENTSLLNLLTSVNSIIVTLGVSNKYMINLLDTSILKMKFTSVLDANSRIHHPPFSQEELNKKIDLFLKDHGPSSLFERLNNLRYYIVNGIKMYITGDLRFDESKEDFLLKGIESWQGFIARFKKYSPYLILAGYRTKMEEIKTNSDLFNNFINDLDLSLTRDKIEISSEILNQNIELLKKIDEILSGISKELGGSNELLQDPGN
jgi:hypothetical protein